MPHRALLAVPNYRHANLVSTLCRMLQVWVIRTLRTRADRPAVKAGKDIPSVSLQELYAPTAFGRMGIGRNPNELVRLLQEE